MKKGGYILIVTLMIMAVIMATVFATLNLFEYELFLNRKVENDLIAEEAARAGLWDGIYHLKVDPEWKEGFESVKLPETGATYSMTFDGSRTDIPWSSSNYMNSYTIHGWNGKTVPVNGAHLISVGEYGNSKIRMEAVISFGDVILHGPPWDDWNETFDSVPLGCLYGFFYTRVCLTKEDSFKDYTLEVKLDRISGINSFPPFPTVGLRVIPGEPMGYQYYTVWWHAIGPGYRLYLSKTAQSHVYRVVASYAIPPEYWDAKCNLRIKLQGKRITIYLNGEKAIDFSDPDNDLPEGKIFFDEYFMPTYKEITVYTDKVTVKSMNRL